MSEDVDQLRRFPQSSKALNNLSQANLILAWLCCEELGNAKDCLLKLFHAHLDCINPNQYFLKTLPLIKVSLSRKEATNTHKSKSGLK